MIKKITSILLLTVLIGCNSSKSTITTSKNKRNTSSGVSRSSSNSGSTNEVVNSYVNQYKDVAMKNMKKYGIPASIILAQGILESGAGKSDLSQSANNHFGIKCHNDWLGESVRHDDDSSQECFRKYRNSAESYDDHANFLIGKSRYASLFDLSKDDYKGWARGLRKAGYATDPRYPEKLISYIERYDLAQYDAQVLGKKYVYSNSSNNSSNSVSGRYHEVQKGDTLYSISKKYNVLIEDIKRKNNLSDNTLSIGQQIIIN
ncbi:glucosaminidase domain-containing protein [Flavobacterium sp. NG2]|uniref:glucosaminidase domain-containing protein n=1 Tax=Flavobacterium sp. NG2 TaxID=3097547 RepID=UPI002A814013|nr:glucosaminidase domain-containing protein [Flavobacterium sp. NG2]WPR72823.1 glucosaminidase domain-containing protein [Flavobacterium sp. NG2]